MAVGSAVALWGCGRIRARRCPQCGCRWTLETARGDARAKSWLRRTRGLAVTGPEDLDEWSLAGVTREQGLSRWSAFFAGRPASSRLTVSTGWGWLVWEPGDSAAAHLARLAGRVPAPVLVEIAVRDPDSRAGGLSPRPAADPGHDQRLVWAGWFDRRVGRGRLVGGVSRW